jgi:hypothetical protein
MNHIRGCSEFELALKYDSKLYDIQPEHITSEPINDAADFR